MRLDLESVYVLNIIVQEGSFAKAAKRLHKAQSAVSYQIKKLEDHLGIEIFDRSHYRAELTSAGQAIWSEGLKVLEQADRLESLAQRIDDGWEARLDLVIDGSLRIGPVMRALKAMSDQQISTRIQVKTEFLGGVQLSFEQDRADMMLVKEYSPKPTLIAQPLSTTTVILVASKEHPLATRKQLSLDHLLDYVELTIHDSSDPQKQKSDSLQFGGERIFYLSDFASKKRALMMGLGFGWMPAYWIEDELRSGDLLELDYLAGSRHTFTPQLVYRSDKPLGKAAVFIKDLILREYS